MRAAKICRLTAAVLVTAVFSGCAALSDPQSEELAEGGISEIILIFCRSQYHKLDDEIICIRPYIRIEIVTAEYGTEVLNGMTLDAETSEERQRNGYVRG